jgi:hypothetical protein
VGVLVGKTTTAQRACRSTLKGTLPRVGRDPWTPRFAAHDDVGVFLVGDVEDGVGAPGDDGVEPDRTPSAAISVPSALVGPRVFGSQWGEVVQIRP